MPKRSFTKHGHFALVLVSLLALLAVANFWTPNHSFDNAIARVPDANVIETESSTVLARSDSGSKSSSSESSTSEPQSEAAVEQTDDGYEGKDLQVRKADWEACLKRGERLEELVKMQTIPKAEQTEFTKYGDLTKNGWAVLEKPADESIAFSRDRTPVLEMLESPDQPNKDPSDSWKCITCKHETKTFGPGDQGKEYPVCGVRTHYLPRVQG